MESSALVYIILTLVTVGIALFIHNEDYVPLFLKKGYGRGEYRPMEKRQAANMVAEFLIYCLLTGVSACRIAVGNDYWVYRENFKLIFQERHVSSEIGFNLIVKWLQLFFGYDHYLPIFGFFSIVTVFFFIKAINHQGTNYAMSLFLLLTGGYYFNSLNSVRYYLALAIALYSMKYIFRQEYGKFLLCVVLGFIFHKTILLVVPVYLIAWYFSKRGLKALHLVLGGIVGASLIFGKNIYRKILFAIYPYYENSMFDNGRISYINVGRCLCVLALCLVFYKGAMKGSRIVRFYFYLNVAALLVLCCGGFMPESSRIAFYMMISQIFLIPEVIAKIESRYFKLLTAFGVAAAYTFYFSILLKNMYDINLRLLPYLNWIFN